MSTTLVFAPLVEGQEQHGSIEGIVRDSQGGRLAWAVVAARSAAGFDAQARTDSTGVYRFPSLPPGRWEITASLARFRPAKVQNIRLLLGQILTIDLTLQVGSMTEALEVVDESPLIDVRQSARTHNLRDEAIRKLPRGRDFTSLVSQAPGVNSEPRLGGISIDGASASENRFLIDGAETTNLVVGTSGKILISDFVEEIQVKSSGYAAEYGGSTGGVINVVTKSGSNAWHGDALLYLNDDGLNGAARPTLRLKPTDIRQAEYVTYPKDDFERWEPGLSVSGPVVRNRLWFFTGYFPVYTSTYRTAPFADGVTRTVGQAFRADYLTANLSARIDDRTRARLGFNMANSRSEGSLPSPAGTTSPAADLGIHTAAPNYGLSGDVTFMLRDRLPLSLRGGWYRANSYDRGVFQGTRYVFLGTNIGLPGVPPELQHANGYSNAPTNFSSQRDIQQRLAFQLDATHFLAAAGEHQLKAGLQFDRIANDVLEGNMGNSITLRWNLSLAGQRGLYGYYGVTSNGVQPDLGFVTQGDISVNNLGLFLQDSWTIKRRLTLNVGLRTEHERVPSYSADPRIPPTAIGFGFGDKLAPRAGAAWDVRGDGKWKAYASWGIFYDIMKLDTPRALFGGDKWLEYYFALDTPDWPNLDRPGCPPSCPGRLLRGPIDFRHPVNDPEQNLIDPLIEPMKLHELVAGLEHELSPVLSAGVRYVHKRIDVAVEDIGSLDAQQNEIYTIGNPGRGRAAVAHVFADGAGIAFPEARRDYDGIELTLNKRMANRWSGRVSYLLSRLYGNYSGLSQSDENGRTSPNGGRNFDYPLMMFDERGRPVYGVLATDRRHQLKLQAVYEAPFGTSLGLNWFASSGIPRTREASFMPPNNFPVQYRGRNSDGRMPLLHRTDLYLEHEVSLPRRMRLALSANVQNLFDQKTATNYFQSETLGAGIVVTEEQFYRGIDTQALITQQRLLRDPRFLQDSAHQGPRTIRLGLKLAF